MINTILEKKKPSKKDLKNKPKREAVINTRQDTCSEEQGWITRHFYGYDGVNAK